MAQTRQDAKRSQGREKAQNPGSEKNRGKGHRTVEHRQVPYDLDREAARVLATVLRTGEHPRDAHGQWLLEKAAVGLTGPHAGFGREDRVVVQLSVIEHNAVMRVIDDETGETLTRVADRISNALAERRG